MSGGIDERLSALEAQVRLLRDAEEIRALKQAYCTFADGGWAEKPETHAGPVHSLFAEDGVWDGGAGMPNATGPAEIEALFEGFKVMPFMVHRAHLLELEVDGDEASGRWSFLGSGQLPDASPHWFLGEYDETYRRTAQGWRFQSMVYRPVRQSANQAGWGDWPTAEPVAEF
jgi:ketosteroid isomerase-like protein